jgi:Ca-activated chloride channel homolog
MTLSGCLRLWGIVMMIDFIALLFVLPLAALAFVFRSFFFTPSRNTHLLYPSLASLKKRKPTLLEKLQHLPKWLAAGALLAFALALIDPHLLEEDTTPSESPPTEGLAIYLLLDRSGSMQTFVEQAGMTRFEVLKNASIQFIRKFPKDLIGAIAFARAAEVISPLTVDHSLLEKRIGELQVIQDKDQDGTSIGYAIYKTAHLIAATEAFELSLSKNEAPPYKIKKALMIVVTDGFQDPSYLDKGNQYRAMEMDEAANFAKEKGIKVFILNIDPSIKQEKFLPNLHELEWAAEATGGRVVVVDHIADLESILSQIPKGERSEIYAEEVRQKRVSFYPYLISLGLVLIGFSIFCDEAIWRKGL